MPEVLKVTIGIINFYLHITQLAVTVYALLFPDTVRKCMHHLHASLHQHKLNIKYMLICGPNIKHFKVLLSSLSNVNIFVMEYFMFSLPHRNQPVKTRSMIPS